VAALISGTRLAVANAGDSRLYMFTDGSLTQLTRDDTWAATVLASQRGSDAPAPPESMRRVLTNVVGAREQAEVRLSEHDLKGGEMILLCSDGLHGVLDDGTLEKALIGGETPSDIVSHLIKAALAGGARDNITAVVARFDGK
jgi:protein phosphatase